MATIPVIDISYVRYFNIYDMRVYNTEYRELYNYLKSRSKMYGRFADPQAYDEYLLGNTCDNTMTSFYDIGTINDWDNLVYYMRSYLLRVISSTPFYTGPYARETTYILPELLAINAAGILTLDSQPGFFVQERSGIMESYLQLPYIQLLAPFTVIENIIDTAITYRQNTPSSRFLAMASVKDQMMIDNTEDTEKKFPQLQLQEQVASIFFGVIRPELEDMDEFLDYIFRNAFFQDIITIVTITTQHNG